MTNKHRTPTSQNTSTASELDPRWIIAGAVLIVVLALVVIVALYSASTRNRSASSESGSTGQTRYDFTLPSPDGHLSLADFRGQYVLVNFWATWCVPCKNEMPDLYAYFLTHQQQGFTLLAVNYGEDLATVNYFLETNNYHFPVALDINGTAFALFSKDSGLPSSYLIGPDGSLVKAWPPGPITRAMLEQDVTPLLGG